MRYERRVAEVRWIFEEMSMLKRQKEADLRDHPYEIDALQFTAGRICELERVAALFRVDPRGR